MINLEKEVSLKPYNTFGIDVLAKYFSSFSSVDELQELLEYSEIKTEVNTKLDPLMVLGGGSNLLFTKNFDGLVLKNEIKEISEVGQDTEYVFVKAGAGENWHQFVMYCINKNYAGIENLALIPGNVGASPMQNIGAYGVEIKDVFHSLQAYDLQENVLVDFAKADCAFGYRESVFKNKFKNRFAITSVTFKLLKHPSFNTSYGAIETELKNMQVSELNIQNVAQAVINIRTSKLPDPKVIGNAGSFFKNPEVKTGDFEKLRHNFPDIVGYPLENGNVKLAAGWLIEHCGPEDAQSWKGYRKGDAGCHARQALVLVNYGHASGSEIFDLSTEILQSVFQKFGVQLEREVNII